MTSKAKITNSTKAKKPARGSLAKKVQNPSGNLDAPEGEQEAKAIELIEPEIIEDGDLDIDDEMEEILPVSLEPIAAGTKDIVRYDPLHAYLQEIGRFQPLSREEEHNLAVKYVTNKDRDAAYKLVSSNLWLVVKLARDYEKAARSLLDLIQEGNIGLMEAVRNFDPYRGVRFPSYAVWWIKAYIIRFVIANWRMVKLGTTQAQRKLFFNLKKEKEKLEKEGFYPEPKLLAEKLNVKESEIIEMEQRLGSADVSMDMPIGEESDSNLFSVIPSDGLNAEELVSQRQMKELLNKGLEDFASTLKAKELIIFRQRMLGEEKATLQEIADQLSLSKERVRQLEEKIKVQLKNFLIARFGESISEIEFG